jgi:hypothetical protein
MGKKATINTMDNLQKAEDFVHQVAEGDFAGACRLFDSNMVQALPEAKLKETWLQLIGQVGAFQEIRSSQAIERQGYRIGQQDPSIAGLIIMAGMTRPFEDTILDQYTYLYTLSGSMTDEQKAELEQLRAQVARVKDPSLSDRVPAKDLPLGVAAAYWLDLRGYRPAKVAESLAMRIFVLQGGRDYQVTAADDYPAWQEALAEKSNATLKLYPKLSHEFIAGEGPATPQEYLVEGHVNEEVIQDIARWIRKQPSS